MPYIIAHSSFALRVGEPLGCCPDPEARAQFALGSLGPDVYFFDRLPPTPFIPNKKRHGNKLHGADCGELCRAFLQHADDSVRPYFYGFLTHIALDSTLHPYICSRYSGHDHTRFEGDIDAILYARYKNAYDFAHLFQRPAALDRIDTLLNDVSRDTVGAIESGAYARSAKKFFRLFPVLFAPGGKRMKVVSGIERVIHRQGLLSAMLLAAPRSYFPDPMNDSRTPWRSETFPDTVRTDTVDELFADAEAFAKKLIEAAQRGDEDTLVSLAAHRTMSKGILP